MFCKNCDRGLTFSEGAWRVGECVIGNSGLITLDDEVFCTLECITEWIAARSQEAPERIP